ncbi:MAG: PHP domain-containing protein, partial [Desulfobacterales bacterium]
MNQDFKKIDFHIHTPVSKCYSAGEVTFQQIAEAATDAGLQAIAITDHNSCEAVASIKEHVGN